MREGKKMQYRIEKAKLIDPQSKTKRSRLIPFQNQTVYNWSTFDHWKPGHVQFLDPHCIRQKRLLEKYEKYGTLSLDIGHLRLENFTENANEMMQGYSKKYVYQVKHKSFYGWYGISSIYNGQKNAVQWGLSVHISCSQARLRLPGSPLLMVRGVFSIL